MPDDLDQYAVSQEHPDDLAQYSDTSDLSQYEAQPSLVDRAKTKLTGMVSHAKDAITSLANDVYDVSTPNIAVQLHKHMTGQPNKLEDIPPKALIAFLTAGGIPEAGEAAEAGKVTEAAPEAAEAAAAPEELAKYEAPRPKAYRVRPKDSPNIGEGGYHMSGESALNHYGSYLGKDDLVELAQKRGIKQSEISKLLSEGKEVQGTGEGGRLTAEDIQNNLKTEYPTQKLWNRIQDTYTADELEKIEARGKIFQKARIEAKFLGKGTEKWIPVVKAAFFPEFR